jgi:hypothetical protein
LPFGHFVGLAMREIPVAAAALIHRMPDPLIGIAPHAKSGSRMTRLSTRLLPRRFSLALCAGRFGWAIARGRFVAISAIFGDLGLKLSHSNFKGSTAGLEFPILSLQLRDAKLDEDPDSGWYSIPICIRNSWNPFHGFRERNRDFGQCN